MERHRWPFLVWIAISVSFFTFKTIAFSSLHRRSVSALAESGSGARSVSDAVVRGEAANGRATEPPPALLLGGVGAAGVGGDARVAGIGRSRLPHAVIIILSFISVQVCSSCLPSSSSLPQFGLLRRSLFFFCSLRRRVHSCPLLLFYSARPRS